MTNAVNIAQGASNNVTFRNRIINGAMVIDQRNAGASVTQNNSGIYCLDRWFLYGDVTSKFTVQQNAGSVTPPVGFVNYLGATSSSAYSVGSGEQFVIQQLIEGYNIADLGWGTANAKTITLSFQVYSSLTGTFGGSLKNSGGTRSYPFSFSIPVANTWTAISVTIAGDTSGTWLTTNGLGIRVNFSMGTGSTLTTTAGAWAAGNYNAPTGATSVVGTSGATFYITGVQLEAGTTASPFEYRQYGTELQLCQRYYYLHVSGAADLSLGDGSMYNTTVLMFNVNFAVSMRTAPTLVQTTGTNYYRFYRNNTFDDFDGFTYWFSVSTRCGALQAESNISGTAGQAGRTITNNASASIAFNSEL